jgi:predicted HTH transcriptional regulator
VKEWIEEALHLLETSLNPVPNELDNIDWKEELSPNNKKLCNHLSAFANYPGGGYLVFGIENKAGKVIGIDKDKNDIIVETLTNIAYENLEPPPKIEYSIQEFHSKSLLFVKISESSVKPVHIKSGSIEDAYIRFGGTTRKATRHQIGQLLLNSKTLRWEELHASKLLSVTEVLNSLSHKNVFDLLKRPALVEPKEILKWMEDERMVKKINGSGYYITNFGAISAATIP